MRETFRAKPWGKRGASHLERAQLERTWANARTVLAAVPEGTYYRDDPDHVLTIRIGGKAKVYLLTNDKKRPKPPASLRSVAGVMSATIDW